MFYRKKVKKKFPSTFTEISLANLREVLEDCRFIPSVNIPLSYKSGD